MTVRTIPESTTFPTIRTVVRIYESTYKPTPGAVIYTVEYQPLHPKTGLPWQASRGVGREPGRAQGDYLGRVAALDAYDDACAKAAKREARAVAKAKAAAPGRTRIEVHADWLAVTTVDGMVVAGWNYRAIPAATRIHVPAISGEAVNIGPAGEKVAATAAILGLLNRTNARAFVEFTLAPEGGAA